MILAKATPTMKTHRRQTAIEWGKTGLLVLILRPHIIVTVTSLHATLLTKLLLTSTLVVLKVVTMEVVHVLPVGSTACTVLLVLAPRPSCVSCRMFNDYSLIQLKRALLWLVFKFHIIMRAAKQQNRGICQSAL